MTSVQRGAVHDRIGVPRALLASKDGNIYALDRRTHALAFKTPITTISRTGRQAHADGGARVSGAVGGCRVERTSLRCTLPHDLRRGRRLVCDLRVRPSEIRARRTVLGTNVKPTSADTGRGWLTAVDADSGVVRWRFRAPAPLVAGVTHTAGGPGAHGDLAGNFYASTTPLGTWRSNEPGWLRGWWRDDLRRAGSAIHCRDRGNIGRTTFGALGSPTLVVLALGTPEQASAATVRPWPKLRCLK